MELENPTLSPGANLRLPSDVLKSFVKAVGEGDAFIARFNPTLSNPVYKQIGTARSDQFRKLAIDERCILYALGYKYGAHIAANADPSQATGDIFIQKFGPNLNLLGKLQFGTPYEDRGYLYLWNNWLYEGSMVSANLGSFDGLVVTYPVEAIK